MKNASTSDMASTAITTIATEPRICPMMPVTNSNGAKAVMVVSTPTSTGLKTPRTPAMEAAGPTSPCLALGGYVLPHHHGVVHDDAEPR